jgi:carboxypeptidase Q
MSVLAVGVGGMAWYLRGWQPIPDVACARLTEPKPGEEGLLDAISPADLRADTEALAAIQPRNGGTPGEVQAREWVAARFRESGLQDVRLELVIYPRWVGKAGQLTLLTSPAVALPFLMLNGSAATPSEGVTAPLIDVDGGQAMDYAPLSREQTEARIHLAWGGSLHRRDICLNAGRSGAVGVIIAHPDPQPADLSEKRSYLVEAGTSVVLGQLPTVAVSHEVGQRLRSAAGRGTLVRLHVSRHYTLGRGYNVVGELPGLTKEYVALIAHHDAWYSGAADNAAGVGAMLSLARGLSARCVLCQPPLRRRA